MHFNDMAVSIGLRHDVFHIISISFYNFRINYRERYFIRTPTLLHLILTWNFSFNFLERPNDLYCQREESKSRRITFAQRFLCKILEYKRWSRRNIDLYTANWNIYKITLRLINRKYYERGKYNSNNKRSLLIP